MKGSMRFGVDSVAASVAEWKGLVDFPVEVAGSYANGRYANTTAAKEAFPNKIHVQYDVNGSQPSADFLDIEPQDATPADGPAWVRAHNALRGPHVLVAAGLYCSASTVNEVIHDENVANLRIAKLTGHISNLLDAGHRRGVDFLVQSAHYGWPGGKHVCGPMTCGFPLVQSTQYADKGPRGQNVDLTLYEDACFTLAPGFNPHYELFENVRRAINKTERGAAEQYDHYRAMQTKTNHPHRLRVNLLRWQCRWFGRRLDAVIAKSGGAEFHRSWRRRELYDRAAGKRIF